MARYRTPGAPRRGDERPSISVPAIEAVLASNNALHDSDQCRDTPAFSLLAQAILLLFLAPVGRLRNSFGQAAKPGI